MWTVNSATAKHWSLLTELWSFVVGYNGATFRKTAVPSSSASRSRRKRGDCLTFYDDDNRNRRNVGNCSTKDTTSQPRIMGYAVRISNFARLNRLTWNEQTKCCEQNDKNCFLYSLWGLCLFQDQDNDGWRHISVSKRDFVCTSSAVIAWHQLSLVHV